MELFEHRLAVVGRAHREVEADEVLWRVEVVEDDDDLRAAFHRCGRRSGTLRERLISALGDEGAVSAGAVRVESHWDEGRRRYAGHRARNVIDARSPVPRAADVAAAAMAAGGDGVLGPEYVVRDADAVRESLLSDAVQAARRKAERVAAAAERGLGRALILSEEGSAFLPDAIAEVDAVAASFEAPGRSTRIPVDPRALSVAVTVHVVFELDDRDPGRPGAG